MIYSVIQLLLYHIIKFINIFKIAKRYLKYTFYNINKTSLFIYLLIVIVPE